MQRHAAILHSAANRLLLCQRALLLEKLLLPGREERQVGVDHAIPSWADQSNAVRFLGLCLGKDQAEDRM